MAHDASSASQWVAAGLLTAMPAGLPFVYLPDQADPAHLPRLFIAHGAVTVGMCFFIFERGWGHLPPAISWILGAFLAWAGLSITWATDPMGAIYEFLRLSTFVQWFFLAAWAAGMPGTLRKLFWAATMGAGGIAIIGLIQTYQFEVYPYVQIFPPAATFLNKNLAGEYLAGVLPISLALLLREKRAWWGALLAVVFGLMLAYFVMAESRTSWVAVMLVSFAAASGSVLVKSLRGLSKSVFRKRNLARLFLSLVVFAALIPGREHRGVGSRIAMEREWLSLTRLGDLGEGKINTVQVRFNMFRNTFCMILDHPLRGTGLSGFRVHYPAYHDKVVPTPTYSLTVVPERLHNDFMQYVAELGFIGGACLLAFMAIILRRGWRKTAGETDPDRKLMTSALLAAVAVIALIALFSFPLRMPVTALLFWIGTGMLAAQSSGKAQNRETASGVQPLAYLALVVNLLVLFLFFKGLQAGMLMRTAYRHQALGQFPQALAYNYHAARVFPLDWRILDQLVTLSGNFAKDREQALEIAQAFLRRHPYSANGHYRLAFVLQSLERYEEALASLDRALRYSGPSAEVYYLRGTILRDWAKPQQARIAFERALRIDPQFEPAKAALSPVNSTETKEEEHPQQP